MCKEIKLKLFSNEIVIFLVQREDFLFKVLEKVNNLLSLSVG